MLLEFPIIARRVNEERGFEQQVADWEKEDRGERALKQIWTRTIIVSGYTLRSEPDSKQPRKVLSRLLGCLR